MPQFVLFCPVVANHVSLFPYLDSECFSFLSHSHLDLWSLGLSAALPYSKVWETVSKNFYCINTSDVDKAYNDYLRSGVSLRFAKKKTFIPNIEFKFPKVELDLWTIQNRKQVLVNGHYFYIAPLELQIPFKLRLGSEKDIEDARHLFKLFEDALDDDLLEEFNKKLKTQALFQRYVK